MAASTSATKDYYVGPQDGWFEVVDGSSTNLIFLRLSAYPHTHPFYVASGASAPSLAGTAATGTVTFSTGVPTAGQTVQIGSEIYTFVASGSMPFTVVIGGTNLVTATNFTAAVNTNSASVTASDTAGVVTLTSNYKSTVGNLVNLSTNGSNVAVSGGYLTGGANVNMGVLVCHHPFKIANYSSTPNGSKFWVRVINPVNKSYAPDGRLRIDAYADGGVLQ